MTGRDRAVRARQQRRALERSLQKRKPAFSALHAAAVVGSAAFAVPAVAATITVNSTADNFTSGNGLCTLREALNNANANFQTTGGDCVAGSGPDTITFNLPNPSTITLTVDQLLIEDDLIIDAPGQAALTISGNDDFRIFNIGPNLGQGGDATVSGFGPDDVISVTIEDVTLINGSVEGSGAAIRADQTDLTLNRVTISGNTAVFSGGGISFNGYFYGGLHITDSTITGNTASSYVGGGIEAYYLYDPMDLTNTEVSNNRAGAAGGGLAIGTYAGDITITDSTISDNAGGTTAGGPEEIGVGGGIFLLSMGEEEPEVTLTTSTVSDNEADEDDQTGSLGGGIFALGPLDITLFRSTISGNLAGLGGGLTAVYTSVDIDNSTVANNQANDVDGDPTGLGGGIYSYDTALHLNFSTIAGNSANAGGGGLFVDDSNVEIENSIIANNTAPIGPDLAGSATVSYSLLEVITGADITEGVADSNIYGQDPQLGPLGISGSSPTETMNPSSSSPARNVADPAPLPPTAVDQRGSPRVQNLRADMGSVEVLAFVSGPEVPTLDNTLKMLLASILGGIALWVIGKK